MSRPLPRWLTWAAACPGARFVERRLQQAIGLARSLAKVPMGGRVAYVRQLASSRAARAAAERAKDKYLRQLNEYTVTLLHAVAHAGRRYRPHRYPGRLVLFLADQPLLRLRYGPRLAWRALADGGADVHPVPGEHEQILSEPNVRVLAKYFKARLEEAQAVAGASLKR
jgi:thioesterase domain-containing protein